MELQAISVGFVVSSSGNPASVIDLNNTFMGDVSAGTQKHKFFHVSLVNLPNVHRGEDL